MKTIRAVYEKIEFLHVCLVTKKYCIQKIKGPLDILDMPNLCDSNNIQN